MLGSFRPLLRLKSPALQTSSRCLSMAVNGEQWDMESAAQAGRPQSIDDEVKVWPVPVIDDKGRSYGTGRRKTSVARVWIKEGNGDITVNHKRFIDYFQPQQRFDIVDAFVASGTAGAFDVWCTVKGGGISGQAGAVRLGIARALEKYQPELRPSLSAAGMLTRDPRRVERKKPGQKKARKKFQWVKR